MICTLTLNPCIDKTVFIDTYSLKGCVPVRRTTYLSGGKGNNVARALRALGDDVLSLNVIAGNNGKYIRKLLEMESLPAAFLAVPGENRCVTTLVDTAWKQIVLKEETHWASDVRLDAIAGWVDGFLPEAEFLCICGSVPGSENASLPSTVIRAARRRGIPVLLDTTGPALRQGLSCAPEYCKPNLEEAREVFDGSQQEILRQMRDCGVSHPVLSLGESGCISFDGADMVYVRPPVIRAVNSVGSGDSFVAGLVHSLIHGRDWLHSLSFATACGCSNAAKWTVADLRPEELASLEPLVMIEHPALTSM